MKILGSDYDGTLKVNGEVSLANKEAIKKWRAQGNLFGVVTGRSTNTIRQELKDNHLEIDFLVCNNGGVILDTDLEIEKLSLINFEKAKAIIEYIEGVKCNGYVVNDGLNRSRKSILSDKDDLHNAPSTIPIEEMMKNEKVAQIVVTFNEQEDAIKFAEYINQHFKADASAFANISCVDIVPNDVSKQNGLQYIADKMKIKQDNIYSVGDSYNDICMLEAFHGAALNHAVDEVKAKAEYKVDDVVSFIDLLLQL